MFPEEESVSGGRSLAEAALVRIRAAEAIGASSYIEYFLIDLIIIKHFQQSSSTEERDLIKNKRLAKSHPSHE